MTANRFLRPDALTTPQPAEPSPPLFGLAYRKWVLAFVMSLGFIARMLTFHSPLLDHHAWRQADGAMIARNFYRDGLAPLHPETDVRGAQPHGYVATGLEIHAIIFAAVAKIVGYAPEVGRAVSALCFFPSALLLWGFVRVRHGPALGLLAVFVYALGLPLVLYSERAVWNEPILITLSLAAFRATQAYLQQRRVAVLIAQVLALMTIGAVKPQWLIVLLPVAALWIERDGWRSALRWELWLAVILPCATAAAFLWHMRMLAGQTGVVDFGAADKLFKVDDMSGHYVYVISRRLLRDLLGPVGHVAWGVGVVSGVRRQRLAEAAAVIGALAYFVLVSRGNRVHDYYQLALVPGALIAMPEGLAVLGELLSRVLPARAADTPLAGSFVLAWTMMLFCFGRSVSFHSWYEVDADKLRVCTALRSALAPHDLIVFTNYNSPDVLYCLDRRGWLLGPAETTSARLAEVLDQGASVLVSPRQESGADHPTFPNRFH